jgi:formate/nitrite transporter FocA (FNT family)
MTLKTFALCLLAGAFCWFLIGLAVWIFLRFFGIL